MNPISYKTLIEFYVLKKSKDIQMKINTASSALKLSAILVIFTGLVLVSEVYIHNLHINEVAQNLPVNKEIALSVSMTNFHQYGYYSSGAIVAWGVLLYILNTPLAKLIAND